MGLDIFFSAFTTTNKMVTRFYFKSDIIPMNFKHIDCPCVCINKKHGVSSSTRDTRINGREWKFPAALHDDPLVSWYRCGECDRYWIRILFENGHTASYIFYLAHVEQRVIETFHINLIDEIFLASNINFVGGYGFGDRTTVYKGGFPVDPWSEFRKKERLQKAKAFAVQAHGRQMYGSKPYVVHLQHVHEVMKRYRNRITDILVLMAGWLHDVLEDTATSSADLAGNFGEQVADIVYRVTDEPGTDRRQRKRKTYRKIRGHFDATTVKLCDRIANVEASANVPEKLDMYRKEHREFRAAIFFQDHDSLLGDIWRYLDRLLGLDT
jgi:hypothetical protein